MSALKVHKVVSSLPGTLEPSALYLVRSGDGFDLFATNESGLVVAYPLNAADDGGSSTAGVFHRGTAAAPRPAGVSVVWWGHVRPDAMRIGYDRLEPIPVDPPAITGTGPADVEITVGDTDATRGLVSVEYRILQDGVEVETGTLPVTTPQAAETLTLAASHYPAGATARAYETLVRGVPAALLGADSQPIEGGTAADLTSAWSTPLAFTVVPSGPNLLTDLNGWWGVEAYADGHTGPWASEHAGGTDAYRVYHGTVKATALLGGARALLTSGGYPKDGVFCPAAGGALSAMTARVALYLQGTPPASKQSQIMVTSAAASGGDGSRNTATIYLHNSGGVTIMRVLAARYDGNHGGYTDVTLPYSAWGRAVVVVIQHDVAGNLLTATIYAAGETPVSASASPINGQTLAPAVEVQLADISNRYADEVGIYSSLLPQAARDALGDPALTYATL